MWIRSQDKWLLTNVDTSNGIMINEYPDECLISLEYANTSFKLGEYSSKENDIAELNQLFKDGLIELGFSVEKASILREKTSEEIAKKRIAVETSTLF